MQIECHLKRKGGTNVDIGDKSYHFTSKDENGAHVCDVSDVNHIGRFLEITEGYRLPTGASDSDKAKAMDILVAHKRKLKSTQKTPREQAADIVNNNDNAPTGYGQMGDADLIVEIEARTGKPPKKGTSKKDMVKILNEIDAEEAKAKDK